jgi:hypothetical protein
MAVEHTVDEVLTRLEAQTRLLWGEADVERQRPELRQTAEEIALVARQALPPDLEPCFF